MSAITYVNLILRSNNTRNPRETPTLSHAARLYENIRPAISIKEMIKLKNFWDELSSMEADFRVNIMKMGNNSEITAP